MGFVVIEQMACVVFPFWLLYHYFIRMSDVIVAQGFGSLDRIEVKMW